jgi:uncharacterized peroxidase-related enzyme
MINPIEITSASPESQSLLQHLKKQQGMIANAYRVMAHSPAALQVYVHMSDDLKGAALTPRQCEIIALRVAALNACEYCLAAHRLAGRLAKLSSQEIQAAEEGHASSVAELALLDLVTDIVAERGAVQEVVIQTAKNSGLTDEVIVEVVAHVAMNTMTNYLNRLARTKIDFGRTAKIATEVMARLSF